MEYIANWITNHGDTTDWLMVLITFIYVVATVIICHYNGKSAKSAEKQVAEVIHQQKQNVRIQFLDKRIEIISCFDDVINKLMNDWEVDIQDSFFGSLMSNKIKALFDDDFVSFHNYLGKAVKKIIILNGDYDHAERRGDCNGRSPEDIRVERENLCDEILEKYIVEKNRIFDLYISCDE
ncbi:MAG: hypothetical protein LUF92_00345 [Clostridiales bacterium]|nr:hypothetical protein [Clostridiales bacterium]